MYNRDRSSRKYNHFHERCRKTHECKHKLRHFYVTMASLGYEML